MITTLLMALTLATTPDYSCESAKAQTFQAERDIIVAQRMLNDDSLDASQQLLAIQLMQSSIDRRDTAQTLCQPSQYETPFED